ncbi:MAG: FAD-binding oxidoreductase, partial [Actinobacteria bacterium]|nr:FAD-binding oxidoreductase [Actinomycetota bacterium]
MKYNKVTEEILNKLVEIVGKNNVLTDKEKIETYSHDETPRKQYAHMPEVVVIPKTAEEIAE